MPPCPRSARSGRSIWERDVPYKKHTSTYYTPRLPHTHIEGIRDKRGPLSLGRRNALEIEEVRQIVQGFKNRKASGMPGMRVEAEGLWEILCHCLHKILPRKLWPQSWKEANIFTFNLGHGFILFRPPTALVLVAKHCSALTPRIFSLPSTAGLWLL